MKMRTVSGIAMVWSLACGEMLMATWRRYLRAADELPLKSQRATRQGRREAAERFDGPFR